MTDDNDPETQKEFENEDDEIILEHEIKSYNDALDVISKLKIFAAFH
nr:unnamed protein product [Callosobruchus chinensis]